MRVAALLPAATDIVIALGTGDQLVAVTHACMLPARLGAIPRVTRSRVVASGAATVDAHVSRLSSAGAPLFELDETLLAAQHPDVVLTQAVCDVCAVREEDARAVAARMRPSPTVATLGASTVEGILSDILTVANALAVPDEGEELVAGLRSRIGTMHRKLEVNSAPRPNVLVLEWTSPAFSAGHWVPDMIRRAGGHEIVGQSGQVSRRVEVDELRRGNAEVMVVAPCGYSLEQAIRESTALVHDEAWAWLQSTPLWAIDASRLTSSPGPGVVHGIEVLSRIIHPALFGEPSPRDAVRISQ